MVKKHNIVTTKTIKNSKDGFIFNFFDWQIYKRNLPFLPENLLYTYI